jgi:sugar/nucleoside kinase (ribokinase family)
MPKLEIAHHGNGNATLLAADWGSECELDLTLLAADISSYDLVHIAALSSAQRQLECADFCHRQSRAKVAAGTYARIAYGETQTVKKLLFQADLFFMNANEAKALLPDEDAAVELAPGHVVYVTDGSRGATIYQGGAKVHVPAEDVQEIDATGAGDAFCGAALVASLLGMSPPEAARAGCRVAALCISGIGPAGLLQHLDNL